MKTSVRIYVSKYRTVILSRHVIFQKTIQNCDEKVKVRLSKDSLQDEFENEENKESITEKSIDQFTEKEYEESEKEKFSRKLRDHLKLKKPTGYENFIIIMHL